MKFLRTLFWVTMLIVIALFSVRNWDTYVPVRLWDDPIFWFRLPVLALGAILVGFLPYYLIHKATRWSMGRKLERTERQLAEVRSVPVPVTAPAPSVSAPSQTLPPAAAPIAMPPGVS
jgi:lipopolysaccharide assembly protein A